MKSFQEASSFDDKKGPIIDVNIKVSNHKHECARNLVVAMPLPKGQTAWAMPAHLIQDKCSLKSVASPANQGSTHMFDWLVVVGRHDQAQ